MNTPPRRNRKYLGELSSPSERSSPGERSSPREWSSPGERSSPRKRSSPRRSRPAWAGPQAFELSIRLLWVPVVVHLLVGLSLLAVPSLWRAYFLGLAAAFPELTEGLSQSMLAAGLLHMLLAGILLFVLSAYRKKAAWAWWAFMVAFTLGGGGIFFLQVEAGIVWAAVLSALLVLLGWVALGLGAGEVYGLLKRRSARKSRPQRGAVNGE